MKTKITNLALALIFLLNIKINAQTAAGPFTVGAAANNTSTNTVSWGIYFPNYIQAFGSGTNLTKGLKLTSFGFSIPGTASVVGVQAVLSGSNIGVPKQDTVIKLLINGNEVGNNMGGTTPVAGTCGTVNVSRLYGANNNKWGLSSILASDVNSPNFGFVAYFKLNTTYVFLSDETFCGGTNIASMTVYYTTGTGIIESQTSSTGIYSYKKTIYFKDPINEMGILNVYNLLGEKVYSSTIEPNQTQADLDEVNAGLYVYKLKIGNREFSQKIVLE